MKRKPTNPHRLSHKENKAKFLEVEAKASTKDQSWVKTDSLIQKGISAFYKLQQQPKLGVITK